MICKKCQTFNSGDWCKTCGTILFEKPSKPKTIKKRSDKGAADDLIYKALRIRFLKDNPRCKMYPDKKATTVHHSKGRIGKNYLDVSTWIPLSFEAHCYIEAHPEFAYENGYSQSRLKTT